MMKWSVVVVLIIHGLIHLMGFAKAFGLAELPQLAQPISRGIGVAWLVAGLAVVSGAVLLVTSPRIGWVVGLAAVFLSQAVIFTAWSDAKAGTFANLVLLALVAYGFASQGPSSFRARYRREVQERLAQPSLSPLVSETDLTPLPTPVQRYLRLAGAVGQPRVRDFGAVWRGRIRARPNEPWMTFTAEQHNFVGEPARFFLMDARRGGLPVDVFHSFQQGSATMRVRLLSLFPMVDAEGPDFDRAETVTLFNDLCLLAPAALIDPSIQWESMDERTVRGHYTVGSNTITAVLSFNDVGELVDFVSDDRLAARPGSTQLIRQRWSTPVSAYTTFGPLRLMSHGEGRWHPEDGEFVYIELELLDVQVNGER